MRMRQPSYLVIIWKRHMDIRPPLKKTPKIQPPKAQQIQEVEAAKVPLPVTQAKPIKKSLVTIIFACVGLLLLGATISTTVWYNWALGAPSSETDQVRIVVKPGDTSVSIAKNLHSHQLIRSQLAFNIYTQLTGNRGKLQAGGYVLSPNQPVSSIVEHIVYGKTDEFNITIPPGLTLDELKDHFIRDGFSDQEVTEAFNADFNHPLLATRPNGATLEGYIYPETYRMNADQSLNDLLVRSFDELYSTLREKEYLDEYAKRNLSIHDAIILASIVQKEVENAADQKQVAQVFLKRLGEGIQLGSDVTYMYAAKQMGVKATPSLESPYNTRKYNGLPPGPIANMNPSALEAVAFPASGDYLYFVAGDDGKTYFSRTDAEHEANVAAHCKTLCR